MVSYREVQDDFYHPRLLFRISIQAGREVAHAIPVPDQLGWLISFPVVMVPFLLVAISYANGYYVTIAGLYGGERAVIYVERFWKGYLRAYWREYVPDEFREAVEAQVPEIEIEEKVRREEERRRREKKAEELEKRGSAQTNVVAESKGGRSFRRE